MPSITKKTTIAATPAMPANKYIITDFYMITIIEPAIRLEDFGMPKSKPLRLLW